MTRRSTVAWTLSYLTSIAWQHSLHRVLVFGTGGSFWRSLVWTYVSYTAALILSTLMNDALTQYAGVAHRYAWGITLIATGVLNYYTVKSAFAEVPAKPTEPSKRSSTARNGSTPSADGRKRDSKSSATATRSRSSKQA